MSSSWDSSSIKTLMGSNNGLAGMIGDYNSIKSGSYGKLLKSYYGQATSGTSRSAGSGSNITEKLIEERRNPTVSKEVSAANAKLSSSVSNMTGSLSTLQDKATYEDATGDKAKSALKSYVSAYNDSVESSKKSTMTAVSKNVAGAMRAGTADADKLKEIGITINKDGTMNLDEKKLKSVDADKIKAVFDGNDVTSYGSKVATSMNRASFYISDSAAATSTDSASTKVSAAQSSADLKSSINKVMSDDTYAKTTGSDGQSSYDVKSIRSAAEDFIKNYNATIDSAKKSSVSGVTSNLSAMMKKTAENSGALSSIGISTGSDGKLSMDKTAFEKADMARVSDVFKKYGAGISQNANLLNFYSASQNTSSSGYSATGAYSSDNLVSSLYSGAV
jgi:hypothetical protein